MTTMSGANGGPLVTIVIKAFNEEQHIEKAVESAIRNSSGIRTEIILADSLSEDGTIALASCFPITIVQLTDPTQRSCGIGPEMGYRSANGDFILLMDGDMELAEGFLPLALAHMLADDRIAGVGGVINEANIENLEFRNRTESSPSHLLPGPVDRLTGGGLFRRSALERSGYFTNRNLHAFEELELGLRLNDQGYRLHRINTTCFIHYGHRLPTLQLLAARIKSRYVCGPGELLRAVQGTPLVGTVLLEFKAFVIALAWWVAFAISLLLLPWSTIPTMVTLPIGLAIPIAMAAKKKSLMLGIYAPLTWSIFGIHSLLGYLREPLSVTAPLPTAVIKRPHSPTMPEADKAITDGYQSKPI